MAFSVASAATLLVILALFALDVSEGSFIRHLRDAEADLRDEASLRVQVHAALMRRLFDHVEMIHALTTEDFTGAAASRPGLGEAVQEQLRALSRQGHDGVFQAAIISADGTLTWSAGPSGTVTSLGNQEHFRVHADGLRDPFVSMPVVEQESGRRALQLTRPMLDREGAFLGISVVSVDAEQLTADLALVRPQAGGRALLLRSDGIILASGKAGDSWVGEQARTANLHRILAAPQGVELMQGLRTTEPRVTAWERIADWPIFVLHSLPHELALREAETRTRPERIIVLTGMGALWFLAVAALASFHALSIRQAMRYATLARKETDETIAALPGAAYRLYVGPNGFIDWCPATVALATLLGGPRRLLGEGAHALDGFLDQDGRAARQEFNRRLIDTDEAVVEYNVVLQGEGLRRVREHARVFVGGSGDERQVAGLLTDVTAQRELEAQLATAARMTALADMATGLAHEVNQPAGAIALGADIALLELDRIEAAGTARVRAVLEELAEQTVRLGQVISNFRAFSMPDAEERELIPQRVDIAIAGASRIVEGILHGAGITLRVITQGDLPLIRCQVIPLERIIANLVVNARDAILSDRNSTPAVELSAEADPRGTEVLIAVRDHGPGFTEDVLPHVFEPFFTTKGPDQGTGLGLSIVHTTMKRFGGKAVARNHPGGGAEVILVFPAVTQA